MVLYYMVIIKMKKMVYQQMQKVMVISSILTMII